MCLDLRSQGCGCEAGERAFLPAFKLDAEHTPEPPCAFQKTAGLDGSFSSQTQGLLARSEMEEQHSRTVGNNKTCRLPVKVRHAVPTLKWPSSTREFKRRRGPSGTAGFSALHLRGRVSVMGKAHVPGLHAISHEVDIHRLRAPNERQTAAAASNPHSCCEPQICPTLQSAQEHTKRQRAACQPRMQSRTHKPCSSCCRGVHEQKVLARPRKPATEHEPAGAKHA